MFYSKGFLAHRPFSTLGAMVLVLGMVTGMGGSLLAADPVNGLLGMYYKDNNLTQLAAVHVGETVNMNVGGGRPDVAVGTDNFSIRWTGQVTPSVSGSHTFYLRADDGIRLKVNNQLIIDKWIDQSATEWSGTISLTAAVPVSIEVEYYEKGGDAVCQLSWAASGLAKQIIPASSLTPPSTITQPSGLMGLYFTGMTLTNLAATHYGEAVNMDVGGGTPEAAVGSNTFSIRWLGQVTPGVTGTHTFYLRGDDGIRLKVNNQLIINKWIDQGASEWNGTIALTAGVAVPIEIEYYENGGDAVCQLSWAAPGLSKQIIPATSLSVPADTQAPSAISALAASYVSDRAVTLGWTAATDDVQIGAYTIARDGVVIGTTLATSWTDSGRTANTTASYTVRARDAAGKLGPLSTALPVTTVTAPPVGTGAGLAATYFSDIKLITKAKQRTDATINFNWGTGSPDPAVPADNFTAMWIGEVQARYSESYTFYISADDHARLWVGNTLLIDSWAAKSSFDQQATIALQAGQKYPIRIDYWEQTVTSRISLQYSSMSTPRAVIPATQLYPAPAADPLQNDLLSPLASITSPAWCEGLLVGGADSSVTITKNGVTVPVVRASTRRWYANTASGGGQPAGVQLTAGQGTPLTVVTTANGANTSATHTLTWTVTDVTGAVPGQIALTIRPGDSLLVTASSSGGTALALDPAYNGTTFNAVLTGSSGQPIVVTYPTSGLYTLAARVNGVVVGSATVKIPTVDFLGPIASQVNYQRAKDVTIMPASLTDAVSFTSNDESRCQVAATATTATGATMSIRALYEDDYTLQARIGGVNGPLLKTLTLDDFVASSTAATSMKFIEQYADGTKVVEATLSMRPVVPNLTFSMHAFVSGITFMDSTANTVISTNDFVESNGVGRYTYRMLVAPGTTAAVCHTITITQNSVRISR